MSIFKINTIAIRKERMKENGSLEEQLLLCGNNTGNAVFFDALDSEIMFDDTLEVDDISKKYSRGDILVFPAANWINRDADVLKAMFLPLEHLDIKIAVIGLGIQLAEWQGDLKEFCCHMDRDARRALKIMSEHAVSIGVRGDITAECLYNLGIHNVDVIGCPSFYSDGLLRKDRGEKKQRAVDEGNICFNIMPGCRYNAETFLMGMRNHWLYILQSRMDFPEFIKLRMAERGKEDKIVCEYYKLPEVTIDSVDEYIKQHGEICWYDDMWRKVYHEKNISFTFGSRFHGNMMAYLQGIPALWIEHDLRIKELTELFQLPHIQEHELDKAIDIEWLKEQCIYPKEFWKNRTALFERYINFLEKNHLKHFYE